MFNLFGSKNNEVKVNDKVWLSTKAKLDACRKMAEANSDTVFVCWFEDTFREVKAFAPDTTKVLMADHINPASTAGKMVIFAEHHPLASVEQPLFEKLGFKEVPVLSALDEPFFEKFGGSNTIEIMKKLGMDENEAIGHSMITKAIRNAQKKIAEKSKSNFEATSQKEWMQRNV